ncbi:hypothetical protein P3S68_005524 [Capsicum galapagoense]
MKMRRQTAVTPPVMAKRPLKLCNEIVIEFMLLSGPARIGSFLDQFRSISRIFPFSVSSLTALDTSATKGDPLGSTILYLELGVYRKRPLYFCKGFHYLNCS